jgi:hypothetical protein
MVCKPRISKSFFFAVLMLSSIYCLCAEAAQPEKIKFPIRLNDSGRYFEDQNGMPVLVHGDSAWSLMAQLDLKETEFYLNHRKSQGFNAILVNLIERKFSANPPRNASGERPFLRPGDFSTPNEAYFVHADAVITMAAKKGLLVFLVPAYLGWKGGDEGWFQDIRIAGADHVRQYGRFVGSRYKTYSNIVWVLGGDFTPPRQYQWSVDALAEGIREGGATQLMTAHCGQESPASAFGNRKWLDFNNVYSQAINLYDSTIKEYQRKPVKPFIMIESVYEGEHNSTPDRIRRQAYWSILTGAAGHFYGNNPVWNFSSPSKVFPTGEDWKDALDSRGAKDMSYLWKLLHSVRWDTLKPDAEHGFLVAGYGETGGEKYSTAAVTSDGNAAILYVAAEAPNRLSLDLKKVAQRYQVMWIDPTNGKTVDISALTDDHGGRKAVTTPGKNDSGAKDWILYFRAK